jgi:hypothetical protein
MEVHPMASHNNNLLRYLSEYRNKSISQSFEELLTNSINIREGIRIIASTSHQNLRRFLQEECERDSGFPSVLNTVDSDFLGGSFARHTKTRPLDDIDIYLPLDGANLFYFEHGARLPYTVLSDGSRVDPAAHVAMGERLLRIFIEADRRVRRSYQAEISANEGQAWRSGGQHPDDTGRDLLQ